ncbi:MAG: hypothetical protein WCX13_01225, partial [Candidatus Hydrogenedentales bacterium]
MRGRNASSLRVIAFAAVAFTLSPLIAFTLSSFQRTPGIAITGDASNGDAVSAALLIRSLFSPSSLAALRFSLTQAFLSTLLALIIGFPGAYFIAKYDFRGRRFFLALAAIPFCLPSILVILSFILYYGKNG